jgi:hypothetical protein
MPKEFFTERDIEDMVKRGTTTLELNDNVVLTELAYERAQRLGMQLIALHDTPPAAPVRPYISKGVVTPLVYPVSAAPSAPADLRQRIHAAVTAKMGTQVDPVLLDAIIDRVVDTLGRK